MNFWLSILKSTENDKIDASYLSLAMTFHRIVIANEAQRNEAIC